MRVSTASSRMCRDILILGNQLASPPWWRVDKVIHLLRRTKDLLSKVNQSPSLYVRNSLRRVARLLVAEKFSSNPNIYVNSLVRDCLAKLTTITAPDVPYERVMKIPSPKEMLLQFESKEDASTVQSIKDTDHCLDVNQLGVVDSSSKDEQQSSEEEDDGMSAVSSPARLVDLDIARPKPHSPAKFSKLQKLASVCEDLASTSGDGSGKDDEYLSSKDSENETDGFSGSEITPLNLSNKKSPSEDAFPTPETGHIEVNPPRQAIKRGSSGCNVAQWESSQKQPKSKKTVSSHKKSQVEDSVEDFPNTSSKIRVHYEECQLDEDLDQKQDDGHVKEVAGIRQHSGGTVDQIHNEKEFQQDEDNVDQKQGGGTEKEVPSIYQRLDGIVALIHQMQIAQQDAYYRYEQWNNHVDANIQTIASNQQELLSRINNKTLPLPTPSFFNTCPKRSPLDGPEKEIVSICQCLNGIVALIHQMQISQQEAHYRFEQWQDHVDANFQIIASNQQELLLRIIGRAPPLPIPSFFNISRQPRPLDEPDKEVASIYRRLDGIIALIHQMQIAQQDGRHHFEQWQNHVDANFQTIASNQQELLSSISGRAPSLPTPSFFNTSL